MNEKQVVKTIGMELNVGQSINNQVCPFCNRKDDKQFSVTRTESGLLYKCFRAKCPAQGFVPSVGHSIVQIKHRKPKMFDKPTRELSVEEYDYIHKRWGILYPEWYMTTDDVWLVLPLKTYYGHVWGYQTKRMEGEGTKNITYRESDYEPGLHFPGPIIGDTINLVEDAISAERVPNGVALLGTHMTFSAAMHLKNIDIKRIDICLDADATGAAYKIKQTYNLLFRDINIITWNSDNDPKDMDYDEFYEVFYAKESDN